jgi:hypothetical protein
MTSVSLSAGSTLTTLGGAIGCFLRRCLADRFAGGVDDGGDLFFDNRAETGECTGFCDLIVGLDGSGLLDLAFELLLLGLVLGNTGALTSAVRSTYSS